jgi:putative flavoprotein involved in K+ transport
VLFDVASRRQAAVAAGRGDHRGVAALGKLVMVPSVRAARERGVFTRLVPEGVGWPDDTLGRFDTIIWCTGFRPDLGHLDPLGLSTVQGVPATIGTRSVDAPRLHLLGCGGWTGTASATIIGAARTAKACVAQLTAALAA